MLVSSPTQPSLPQEVARSNDHLRSSHDFANLPEAERASAEHTLAEDYAIASRLDGAFNDIQSRWKAQQAGQTDPARAKVIAATHKAEIFDAIERAATDLDRQDRQFTSDLAAHETTLEHVASGRLVLDKTSGGATLTKAIVPTGDELRALQKERSALRELPQDVIEDRYLAAVNRGDNPRLIAVIESAPSSLPLVRAHARERARKIRVDNYSSATRISHTKNSLALRSMSHGHASRAIEKRIEALKRLL